MITWGVRRKIRMKELLSSAVLILVAITGGAILGIAVRGAMFAVTANLKVSSIVGTIVWMLATPLGICYGQLLPQFDHSMRSPFPNRRAEGKLQTAELRFGFMFAILGATGAVMANVAEHVMYLVAIVLAVAGGLIGHDYKRRVFRLRQAYESGACNSDPD